MVSNSAYSYVVNKDTICAVATPSGVGAIAVIRLSGPESFSVGDAIFTPYRKGVSIQSSKTHKLLFGVIKNNEGEIVDEVLISVFRNPHSYTGEDSIEISCHGSEYIQQKLLELLFSKGVRLANPGEYTMRAFANGKLDLSQAEAVADLISSHSKTSHDLAIKQMRGGYSKKIKELRSELVNFASLIELELDFSEEDVEFADRKKFFELIDKLKAELVQLINSFSIGNVIKKGIPVTIIGDTNVGKSTLLNALLNEEKAIVSEVPGTTRDVIEDSISINGVTFRFIDTAGLRQTDDTVEKVGIKRTYEQIEQASIILYVFDTNKTTCEQVLENLKEFSEHIKSNDKKFILIANKIDELIETPKKFSKMVEMDFVFISAKRKENIEGVVEQLLEAVNTEQLETDTVVSNARHYHELKKTLVAVNNIEEGFKTDVPSDLIAIDIRTALHHLGEITGEVTTDEILGNIFGNFCVGK